MTKGCLSKPKFTPLLMEAMGDRVALQAQFPNLTFILDRPHLKQHLYSGAEAMGLTDVERHKWVSDKLHIIDAGDVRQVIRTLKGYQGLGSERIANLFGYLKRLRDAVNYDYFRAMGLPIGSGEIAHRSSIYSPEALEDSGCNLASRYSKSHPGVCVLFGLTAGEMIFGRKQSAFHEKLNTRKSPFG